MNQVKITKIENGLFRVNTGKLLADLREHCDVCELSGNTLRTFYGEKILHTVPSIKITLGPISFAAVSSLNVGESFEVKQ